MSDSCFPNPESSQPFESKLGKLYSRLDQTKAGSKESKQFAEEIIEAIGYDRPEHIRPSTASFST